MVVHLRRRNTLAALVVVLGFALLLPGRGAPMHSAVAGPVTMSMSAPTNVLVGTWFDYTITLTYTGELSSTTADYTFTDALPAQVRFISLGINSGSCPTLPPSGQTGTVTCNFKFAPDRKTITIRISVETTANGSVTNSAQLASGETAGATTSVDAPPPGSITASLTGPEAIQLSSTAAPARFNYTLVLNYAGPPINGSVYASFVERLPEQMSFPGIPEAPDTGLRGCKGDDPIVRFGGTFSCNFYFTEDHRTRTVPLSVRPTGRSGDATNVVELSTGATATWTTTVVPPPPEPEPPAPAPGPVAGPPAAPTTTVAETFTKAGTAEPEAVNISPTAETVQVALTWANSDSSFDAVGFTLTSGARTLAVFPSSSEKLRVTKKRGAKWLDVRIKGLHKGKLKFKIVAKRVHGRTRVIAKIRQSKR